MKISRVSIENFRSIKKTEFNCSNFNVFVGQNNAGKTNFFEAIEWFFNGLPKGKSIRDLHPNRDTEKEICVEIEFSDAQHGAKNMRNEGNREKCSRFSMVAIPSSLEERAQSPQKKACY